MSSIRFNNLNINCRTLQYVFQYQFFDRLTSLTLNNNENNEFSHFIHLFSILYNFPNLKTLNISNNILLCNEFIDNLSLICPNITKLRLLSENKINNLSFAYLFQCYPKLTHIRMETDMIYDLTDQMYPLVTSFHCNILQFNTNITFKSFNNIINLSIIIITENNNNNILYNNNQNYNKLYHLIDLSFLILNENTSNNENSMIFIDFLLNFCPKTLKKLKINQILNENIIKKLCFYINNLENFKFINNSLINNNINIIINNNIKIKKLYINNCININNNLLNISNLINLEKLIINEKQINYELLNNISKNCKNLLFLKIINKITNISNELLINNFNEILNILNKNYGIIIFNKLNEIIINELKRIYLNIKFIIK